MSREMMDMCFFFGGGDLLGDVCFFSILRETFV